MAYYAADSPAMLHYSHILDPAHRVGLIVIHDQEDRPAGGGTLIRHGKDKEICQLDCTAHLTPENHVVAQEIVKSCTEEGLKLVAALNARILLFLLALGYYPFKLVPGIFVQQDVSSPIYKLLLLPAILTSDSCTDEGVDCLITGIRMSINAANLLEALKINQSGNIILDGTVSQSLADLSFILHRTILFIAGGMDLPLKNLLLQKPDHLFL
jgi:hypothetical protein